MFTDLPRTLAPELDWLNDGIFITGTFITGIFITGIFITVAGRDGAAVIHDTYYVG